MRKQNTIIPQYVIKRLLNIVLFFFSIEILLSYKLWVPTNREFPMISAFSWLNFSWGTTINTVLIALLFAAIGCLFLNKFKNIALIIFVCCLSLLILEDITRLQPWVYTQVALIILLTLNSQHNAQYTISRILWLMALVYIWSGLQKFNLGFIQETFPWLLSAFNINFQPTINTSLFSFNYSFVLIPILEIAIGLCLLTTKTRKTGIILGIIMHLFILLCLGPTGHQWNTIILPWNICLILLLLQLYRYKSKLHVDHTMTLIKHHYWIIVVFGVLPIFNFFGYWDNALSSNMYSGTHSNVIFYFDSENETNLATYRIAATLTPTKNKLADIGLSKIWLTSWSIYELNVPFYAEARYFKRYGKQLCKTIKNKPKAGIKIITRSKFYAEITETKCSCLEL